MPLVPTDWNVVVVGRWNRGILTPQGVAERLFRVPTDAEIGFEFPIDAIGPVRVTHGGLTVIPASDRLVVQPQVCDYPSLAAALAIARRAMESLPETPVAAAGYNVRFQAADAAPALDPLVEPLLSPWEQFFVETDKIESRGASLKLAWDGGHVQVRLSQDRTKQLGLELNFERSGAYGNVLDRAEMLQWLDRPEEQLRSQVDELTTHRLKLPTKVFA